METIRELERSSMPALRYLFRAAIRRRNAAYHRAIWLVILLIGCLLSLFLLGQRVQYFASSPQGIEISSATQFSLEFPAIIICNRNQFRTSALIELDLIDKFLSRDAEAEFPDNITFDSVLPRAAHQLHDLIFECHFEGRECINDFQPIITDMGLCYGFNLNGSHKSGATRGHWSSSLSSHGELVLTINVETHEYIPRAHVSSDRVLDTSFRRAGVNVLVDWAGNIAAHAMEKASKIVETGQTVSFMLEASETINTLCDHTEDGSGTSAAASASKTPRTLDHYYPLSEHGNNTYTQRKCEAAKRAERVYHKCNFWTPKSPNVLSPHDAHLRKSYTLKQWLFDEANESCLNEAAVGPQQHLQRVHGAPEKLSVDAECPAECYRMKYRTELVYNNLAVPDFPTISIWHRRGTNPDGIDDDDEDDDDDIVHNSLATIDVDDFSKLGMSLQDAETAYRLLDARNQAIAAVNKHYEAIESLRRDFMHGFHNVLHSLDEFYRKANESRLFDRNADSMSLKAVPRIFNHLGDDDDPLDEHFFMDAWLDNCTLTDNNDQIDEGEENTLSKRDSTPYEVLERADRLWMNLREYMISLMTWKKFHVVRKDRAPFLFMGTLASNFSVESLNALVENSAENVSALVEQTRHNFTEIDSWLASLHPELRKAVLKARYPIQDRFNWHCPVSEIGQTRILTTTKKKLERTSTSHQKNLVGQARHTFWRCLDGLRIKFEHSCLDPLTRVRMAADDLHYVVHASAQAAHLDQTVMFENCQQVASQLETLHSSIADEKAFDDLKMTLREDFILDPFSEDSKLWDIKLMKEHLLPAPEWARFKSFVEPEHDTKSKRRSRIVQQRLQVHLNNSFSEFLSFMNANFVTLTKRLRADAAAFLEAVEEFKTWTIGRDFRRSFGMGSTKLPYGTPGYWNLTSETFANDHMVRYLRATDEYAARFVFDEKLLVSLSDCFMLHYARQAAFVSLEVQNVFARAEEMLLREKQSKVDPNLKLIDDKLIKSWYKSNFLELRFQFGDMVLETIVQRPSYDFWALMSDFGGIVGLTLGASLMTVAELGYILACYVGSKKNRCSCSPKTPNTVCRTCSAGGISQQSSNGGGGSQKHKKLQSTKIQKPGLCRVNGVVRVKPWAVSTVKQVAPVKSLDFYDRHQKPHSFA